jgi:hypothetical protein
MEAGSEIARMAFRAGQWSPRGVTAASSTVAAALVTRLPIDDDLPGTLLSLPRELASLQS